MIQPFRLGDTFLIQRLGRQATNLNAVQALMQPNAPVFVALTSVIPWGGAKATTYVLNQQGHTLVRAGFIQVQKRTRRAEYDINLLAPALDTPSGHPAIWEKLLSHTIQEAARFGVERIYVDVSDQPLPVSSFAHVGFTAYTRQTIWRLRPQNARSIKDDDRAVRAASDADEWALCKLYARVTPLPVQQAECSQGLNGDRPPIVDPRPSYGTCRRYVLIEDGELTGCLHIQQGRRGTFLFLWTDMLESSGERVRHLIRFGVKTVWAESARLPIYVGVNDYHGGLSAVLHEFGFSPFTDRARMVKHLRAWVKEGVVAPLPALESVGKAVTTSIIVD